MIDAIASEGHFVDHLVPIWDALGTDRGKLYARRTETLAKAGRLPGFISGAVDRLERPVLALSYGDYVSAVRSGRSKIALGQHGAGQSYGGDERSARYPSYPGGAGQDAVSLFLVPNEHAARRTRQAYPKARVEIVGCPKLDGLPRKADRGRVVAVSTHWNGTAIPETMSAWLTFDRAILELGKRFEVLGHAHPRMLSRIEPLYRMAGIEVVSSFDEILRRADVYVCDNSSSIFEFAATGRPVVLLDDPRYRPNIEHGLRFWSEASVGIRCPKPADLAESIERALERRPEDEAAREAALDRIYQPRTGSAALAAGVLRDWAKVNTPTPLR